MTRLFQWFTILFATALLCGTARATSVDDSLLFAASFDTYSVDADFSRGAGDCLGFPAPDLQLRMFPGVAGKGNAVNVANNEACRYAMPGNFDPRQGTLSLWICPQNWNITDDPWQVFFHAEQKQFQMQVFKVWPNYILARIYLRQPGRTKPLGGQVQIRVNPEDWRPGRWHKLDIVWNDRGMKFYLDGVLSATRMHLIVGDRAVPPNRPDFTFPERVALPEAAIDGWFTLGLPESWQKRKEIDPEHRTAIDEVKIYNRLLNAAEIRTAYEAWFPPATSQEDVVLNLLTVPQTTGITLDGRLEEAEWHDAATAPILNSAHQAARIVPATVSVKSDAQNLYVAFRQEIACAHAQHTEPDAKLWEDDSFEFHLRSETSGQSYQFIVNGNGALFDQLNLNPGWQSEATVAAFKGDDFWSAELAIPLAAFGGLDTLQNATWSANFCASFKDGITLKQNYTVWSNAPKAIFQPTARIRFSREPHAYRLERLGALDYGQLDLFATAVPEVEGAVGTATVTMAGWPDEAYPGNVLGQTWSRLLNPGRQALSVSVKRGQKECFYYGKTFTVNRPLELSHDNDPATGRLRVNLDFSSAGEDTAKKLAGDGIDGQVAFRNTAGDVLCVTKFTAREHTSRVILNLPDNVSQGTYTIHAETTGEHTTFVSDIPFRVPDLTPYREKVAADHEVPVPWTPVEQVTDTVYRVLDRTYAFDGRSPFPTQIVSRGEAMLVRSPKLMFDLGAGEQDPVWESTHVGNIFSDRVEFTGTGKIDGIAVEWNSELHFDGLYKVVFSLMPSAPVTINRMTMNWQVPTEHAKFFLTPVYVPWQDGRAESHLQPGANRKDNVLWLSGHEKGLLWWGESDANWVNEPGENPLVAVQGTDTVEATLKMISMPAELDQKATYAMAFMGTPSRRPPEAFRAINNTMGWGRSKGCTVQYISGGNFSSRRIGDDLTSLNSLQPAYPVEFDKIATKYKSQDIKPIVYNMPGDVSNAEPEYDWFGRAGQNLPGRTHSGVKLGQPWTAYKYCGRMDGGLVADLWAYNLDRLLVDQPACAGLYYDCGSVNYCSNPRHGCGGVDVFGKHFVTSEALGLREIYLRTYKVAKQHSSDNVMMLHSHIQFNPMVHAFGDYWLPGENTFRMMSQNLEHGYCEDISLEEYQSDYNWRTKGVAICMLVQQGRSASMVPALNAMVKETQTEPRYALSSLAAFLVHDFNIAAAYVSYAVVEQWWTLKESINLGKVKDYHGYWKSDAVKSASPKIYCGWYEWEQPMPYDRVLVVSNFAREDQPAALTLDKQALGIEGRAVIYHDLWNDAAVIPESELATMTVGGNNFLLIGIKDIDAAKGGN